MKKRLFTSILVMMAAMALPSSVWADTETYDFKTIASSYVVSDGATVLTNEADDGSHGNRIAWDTSKSIGVFKLSFSNGSDYNNTFNNRFACATGKYSLRNKTSYQGLWNQGNYDFLFAILDLKTGDKVTITQKSGEKSYMSYQTTYSTSGILSISDGESLVSGTTYTVQADGNLVMRAPAAGIHIEKIVIETQNSLAVDYESSKGAVSITSPENSTLGTTKFYKDQSVTLKAIAVNNYQFAGWKASDGSTPYGTLPNSVELTLTMPDNNLSLNAAFEAVPAVSAVETAKTWTFDNFAAGTILTINMPYGYDGYYVTGYNTDVNNGAKISSDPASATAEQFGGEAVNVSNCLYFTGKQDNTSINANKAVNEGLANTFAFRAGCKGVLYVLVKNSKNESLNIYINGTRTQQSITTSASVVSAEISEAANIFIGANGGSPSIYAVRFVPTSTTAITDEMITLGNSGTLTYTGEQQTMTVTVKDGNTNLVENTDYTVTGNTGTEVNTYTLTITGTGSYSGSVEKTWSIGKGAGSISYATTAITKTVGDAAFTNELTKVGDGTVTYSISTNGTGSTIDSDGKVTVGNTAGSETITATVTSGTNFDYATTTATYTLTVNAKAAEETISTAKTWTFDSYNTGDYYANNSNSYIAVDGLYARSLDTRKFVITAGSEATAYSFTDGTSGTVTNYAKISGEYSGTNATVTSAAQNSGYLTPFFAFNTSVAGTCYAWVKSSGNSGENVRIYYTSGNGSFTCPDGAYTNSSGFKELKQTATAGGTFFIGSTTNAVGEIYAIRFVPTHTLTFAADPADKATITIKDGNTALTSGSAIEEGKSLTLEVTEITSGYEIDNVKVNNGNALTATDGKYTFTMPTADATVTVTLKLKSYTLTAAQATNGSISFTVGGQAATTAKMGDEVTVVATPDTNYQLSTLAATPNTVTISDNKFTMPDYDVTVSATFKESSTTPVVTDYYGNYTFRTWASGTDYLSTAGAFSLERGNDGLLSGRAYWKDGDNTVYSQAMPLNSKFSANSGYVQFRKHSDERYQGLYVSESDFNKSQSSITLTINNLKANDWVKITSSENALTFQNSAAKALADYSADIANQVLVSDAYYVISADNTDLPLTFGNSSTGSYIYNIEIGSDELVPAPVISYAEDTHKATITGYSSTKGNTVTVTYSTDEGATWTTYSEGITIPTVGTTTVWAKSTTTGQKESAVAKKVISGIQQTIEAPTIAVSGTMVTITQGTASDTSTEVITWYTLDNSDPTDASNTNRKQYESPFTLTATAYIKAYSVYNDAIGVASDVTTYTDKVRVGTFTAEKNVFDFKALAGDFGSLTFNETAVTLKEVYNNATEEKSFNAITNTDYFTKSDNDASVLLRDKTGNELSQAAGGLTGKDNRGYLAVSGLAPGKRVVVEFAGGKVKYVTGTGEGEVTVDGIQLERNADVTSGKAMTITEGSYIVLFNANGTTITKISVLDAAVMRNVSIATGILNGQVVAGQSSVGDGETVTLTVTPAEGYELDQLIATGGAAISKGTAENTYTFTMPNSDVTVSATFKAISASTEEPTVTEYVAVNAAGNAATVTGVDIAEGATSITISGKAGNIDVTDIDAGTFTAENTANVSAIDLSETQVTMSGARTGIDALKHIDASTLIYLPSTANNVTGTNVVVKSGTGYTCSDFEVDNGKLENGKSVVVPKEFKADKVTLKRTFTADKKCTVCLPYAFTAAGGTFYKFNGISEGKVQMQAQTDGATLEANTPYIFMPSAAASEISTTASGDNKILVAIADAKTADTSTSFTFKGTYEAINWTEKPTKPIYGFAAEDKDGSTVGTFVKIGAGASIKACRAYLEYEGNSTPGSIAETRGMNDLPDVLEIEWIPASGKATTGIEDARRAADDSEAVYNMRGQRVDKNYKGLVIVNGKKVVRK